MAGFGSCTYWAHTMPGLEEAAWRELSACCPAARLLGFRCLRGHNGLVLFEYAGDPGRLLGLRSIEDLFFLAGRIDELPRADGGLGALTAGIRKCPTLEVGLRVHREVRGGRPRGRTAFRVVAQMQGRQPFRRIDLQRAVEKGILQRYHNRWRAVAEDAGLEFWVTLLDREVLYGLRLSDRTMRHRTYKVRHLPASLRPTVAYSMALLSSPQPGDVVLDPLCGAGTILIERAHAGWYRLLLGGDLDPVAVATSRENVGRRYRPLQLCQWDALHLPLADASVDALISNLPFGEQIGTHEANLALYPRLFHEMERVIRIGGRAVLLSAERSLVRQCLARSCFHLGEQFDLRVLGRAATIYVLNRGERAPAAGR